MSVWLLALPVLVVAAVVVRAVSRRRSRTALRLMMAFDAALVVIALGVFGLVLAAGTSTPAVADAPGSVPARAPAHISQLQFHCGNPPPAPEPRTLIFKRKGVGDNCQSFAFSLHYTGQTPILCLTS